MLTAAAAGGPAPIAADACRTEGTGARCVRPADPAPGTAGRRVPARQRPQPFAAGDVLPSGRYMRLLNSEYYGLPPVDGNWRYFEVEGRILRVDPDTMRIIEDVTAEANRAF